MQDDVEHFGQRRPVTLNLVILHGCNVERLDTVYIVECSQRHGERHMKELYWFNDGSSTQNATKRTQNPKTDCRRVGGAIEMR